MPTFQAGLALQPDRVYIRRSADEELAAGLLEGHVCHLLAPRQVGKTSLIHRTAARLRAAPDGVTCFYVSLASPATAATPYAFYSALARAVADQSGLTYADVTAVWEAHPDDDDADLWLRFIEERIVGPSPNPVGRFVLFFDELDAVLGLPEEATRRFFRSLREVLDLRGDPVRGATWRRLTFCFAGVATPADLVGADGANPFVGSRRIQLSDFNATEARGFLPALAGVEGDHQSYLDAVMKWTEGHPYFTQLLGSHILNRAKGGQLQDKIDSTAREADCVDAIVKEELLDKPLGHNEVLGWIDRWFDRHRTPQRLNDLLACYQKLLDGSTIDRKYSDARAQEIELGLRTCGLATERIETDGKRGLRPRNPLFAAKFNREWIRERRSGRRLARQVEEWLESNRHDHSLPRGQALDELLAWKEDKQGLHPDEHEFIAASLKLARDDARLKAEMRQVEAEVAKSREEVVKLKADSDMAALRKAKESADSTLQKWVIGALLVILVGGGAGAVQLIVLDHDQAKSLQKTVDKREKDVKALEDEITSEKIKIKSITDAAAQALAASKAANQKASAAAAKVQQEQNRDDRQKAQKLAKEAGALADSLKIKSDQAAAAEAEAKKNVEQIASEAEFAKVAAAMARQAAQDQKAGADSARAQVERLLDAERVARKDVEGQLSALKVQLAGIEAKQRQAEEDSTAASNQAATLQKELSDRRPGFAPTNVPSWTPARFGPH